MVFANADPKDFRIMGEPLAIEVELFLTPAVADGRMYVRLKNSLVCYDLRK